MIPRRHVDTLSMCVAFGVCACNSGPPPTVVSISTMQQHVCASLSDGSVRCWGSNVFGELGNGTVDTAAGPHPTPTTVGGISNVLGIAGGSEYSCALTQ